VALTGGIACGKSVVAEILRKHGCYIYSADRAAHDVMAPGGPAWKKIVARFGGDILNPDGTVDRTGLGRVVFGDAKARHFLNALIHPLVLAEQARVIADVERQGRHMIFISEAALTVEAGYAPLFDKVVVVHCRESIQKRRLMERDGAGEKAARKKIGSQMPQEEKLRHADYAIDTSDSLAETVEQTERVFAALVQDAVLMRPTRSKPASFRKPAG
jgi:dephospho-CoA kinase